MNPRPGNGYSSSQSQGSGFFSQPTGGGYSSSQSSSVPAPQPPMGGCVSGAGSQQMTHSVRTSGTLFTPSHYHSHQHVVYDDAYRGDPNCCNVL